MTLPDLAHLADATGIGGDPALSWAEYQHIIETAIADQPRSQQVRIGPSELGIDCVRCLAHKLAGVPEKREVAWLPWVGTAVHTQLQDVFTEFNAAYPDRPRFLTETTVSVGEVDGVEITGHADLYDTITAEVSDWKIVGKNTLTDVRRHGPSAAYRKQGHLYARGFTRRGLPVQRVRIIYLPRNEPTLSNAHVWHEDYDEQIALGALARADAIAKAIRTVGVEQVVAGLPPTNGCYSCARYPLPDGTTPALPGHDPGKQLVGLIPPKTPDAHGAGSTAA